MHANVYHTFTQNLVSCRVLSGILESRDPSVVQSGVAISVRDSNRLVAMTNQALNHMETTHIREPQGTPPVQRVQYSRVCGKIIRYQQSSTDAFHSLLVAKILIMLM